MWFQKMVYGFLTITFVWFAVSCGGGGSSGNSSNNVNSDSDDNSNIDENINPDEETATEEPFDIDEEIAIEEPITEVSFDFSGAIGLAIDNSAKNAKLSSATTTTGISNLKRINADRSLSDVVSLGSVTVSNFMVAANNQVYLLLEKPVDGCILIRVNGAINEATCVDSTLAAIHWSNAFGDPIQFDGQGNVYYQGKSSDGKTILRESAVGEKIDLINDNINLSGFLVLNDGAVFISGITSSTGTNWTRIVTPEHSLKSFLNRRPTFLTLFPDNNVYFGDGELLGVYRYFTATNELDPISWLKNGDTDVYYDCKEAGFASWDYCIRPTSIVKTTNQKVYVILGTTGKELVQYYPKVFQTDTIVKNVTLFKSILTYIVLGGFDYKNSNKLVLYDTETDTEVDLLGSEDIEVYHVDYFISGEKQLVVFDGLRFSDNRYVLCQVDLTDNNQLTCSLTGMNKLTDFQLFNKTNTIAGGGTNDTKTYAVGGTIAGLYGTLVLENGEDSITLTQSGSFTFPITVLSDYDVTIQANPAGQTCELSDGYGTVEMSHITSVSVSCSINSGVIVTVAGGGSSGSAGKSVAIKTSLSQVHQVVSDSGGNFYFSEWERIKKVNPDGIITTVAGNGNSGYSGDGGPAISASFSYAWGIAVDSSDNLYIADSSNNVIRKVDTSGIITTVAGTGASGYSGDNESATSAKLNHPQGLALDMAGNLYVADQGNNRVRKVDLNGIITTVAGNGLTFPIQDGVLATTTSLASPSGLAIDSSGNLYVSGGNLVRKVDTSGIITTVAGTGASGYSGDNESATSAKLNYPGGLALDMAGNLYIADHDNHRVRKVDINGIITTVAGNGSNTFAGDGGPATGAVLYYPSGVACDSSGNLFIADQYNDRIRMVAP